MPTYSQQLRVTAPRMGLLDITRQVAAAVEQADVDRGMCNVFIHHTSASLTIQENADPSARRDLEAFLERLVPPNQPYFTHTAEGPDDMPSHIKSVLTDVSLNIPVLGRQLGLGTWQGIYLWEHREHPPARKVTVTVW